MDLRGESTYPATLKARSDSAFDARARHAAVSNLAKYGNPLVSLQILSDEPRLENPYIILNNLSVHEIQCLVLRRVFSTLIFDQSEPKSQCMGAEIEQT